MMQWLKHSPPSTVGHIKFCPSAICGFTIVADLNLNKNEVQNLNILLAVFSCWYVKLSTPCALLEMNFQNSQTESEQSCSKSCSLH